MIFDSIDENVSGKKFLKPEIVMKLGLLVRKELMSRIGRCVLPQ